MKIDTNFMKAKFNKASQFYIFFCLEVSVGSVPGRGSEGEIKGRECFGMYGLAG